MQKLLNFPKNLSLVRARRGVASTGYETSVMEIPLRLRMDDDVEDMLREGRNCVITRNTFDFNEICQRFRFRTRVGVENQGDVFARFFIQVEDHYDDGNFVIQETVSNGSRSLQIISVPDNTLQPLLDAYQVDGPVFSAQDWLDNEYPNGIPLGKVFDENTDVLERVFLSRLFLGFIRIYTRVGVYNPDVGPEDVVLRLDWHEVVQHYRTDEEFFVRNTLQTPIQAWDIRFCLPMACLRRRNYPSLVANAVAMRCACSGILIKGEICNGFCYRCCRLLQGEEDVLSFFCEIGVNIPNRDEFLRSLGY